VCYWPNLGYGHFGAKVTLAGAPWFDHPERFDPGRLRLGDLDGTGPTDILYLGPDGVRVWANQSGNALAAPVSVGPFPDADTVSHVDVADLLGTGTACLVWASPRAAVAGFPVRYLDLSRGTATGLPDGDPRLAGWKPYLLRTVTNNVGGDDDRRVPVAVAMVHSGARRPTVPFMGWFGPRGLASVVFGLLAFERGVPQAHTALSG
jgi:hypothetical protein